MASIQIKPQTPSLAWGRSIVRGIVVCLPLWEGTGTTVRNIGAFKDTASLNGSPTWNTTQYGKAVKFNNTSDYLNLGRKISTSISKNVTVMLHWKKSDTTARVAAAFYTDYGATDTDRFGLHAPFVDGTTYWQFGGSGGNNSLSAAGLTYGNDDIICVNIGPRGSEIWQNSFLRASNTSANTITRTTGNIDFFINKATGALAGDLASCPQFVVWNRQLEKREILQYMTNPNCIYRNPIPILSNVLASAAGIGSAFRRMRGMGR